MYLFMKKLSFKKMRKIVKSVVFWWQRNFVIMNVNITANFCESTADSLNENDGTLTIRIFLHKKQQKLPKTPKEMLENFKLSNEIKTILKPCW